MNCIDSIKKNVKLYTKEKYFPFFSKILKEDTIYMFNRSNTFLTKSLNEKESQNKKMKKIHEKSLWYIIMINIFYMKVNNNSEHNVDLLLYKYLLKLCYIKMKKLLSISVKYKENLDTCINIYLELCQESIDAEKNKDIIQNKQPQKTDQNIIKRLPSMGKTLIRKDTFHRGEIKKYIKVKRDIKSAKNTNRINLKNINKKMNLNIYKQKYLYSNSFTRLFIGDTDEDSVKQRYLSNIIVKNKKRINLHGSYIDLSKSYVKQLYNKIISQDQSKESQKNNINNNNSNLILLEILKMFENNFKKIEHFTKRKKKVMKSEKNSEINHNSQSKFINQSIINYYNYKHNKNNTKSFSSLSLSSKSSAKNAIKYLKKRKGKPFSLQNSFKNKNNFKTKLHPYINKELYLLSEPMKYENSYHNYRYLSAMDSLSFTKTKGNKNASTNSNTNIINKNSDNFIDKKNIIKKKILSNSLLDNNLRKKNNIKNFKNFMTKNDFFFDSFN